MRREYGKALLRTVVMVVLLNFLSDALAAVTPFCILFEDLAAQAGIPIPADG